MNDTPGDPGEPGERFHLPILAVIGVGMIGGSVALALKRAGAVGRVIGAGRTRASLERAVELGVIDDIAAGAADAAAQAGLTLLAAPVSASAELFAAIRPVLGERSVVTDVGSVKRGVCDAADAHLGARARRFVPGHPVAGKEHSGVDAAAADLFENHHVALTPTARTDADALALVRRMWGVAGARVTEIDAELHDRVLSLTSHLPHLLAYAMVDMFAASDDLALCRDMSAGGFYDFTRTASSDVEMWRDICLMNRAQLGAHLREYAAQLERIGTLLEQADGDALERLFADAKRMRATVAERRKTRA